MKKRIQLLGVSGSLRDNSTNTNILKNISKLLPENIDFEIFEGLDHLPHFNPGSDENTSVVHFKTQLAKADGVVFSTPEYAFGVPGVLKNALDWTVATGELNDKPVAAISASPLNSGGDKALASLLLTLTALGTKRNNSSSLSIPNIKSKIDADGQISDPAVLDLLQNQINNLLHLLD